jgi:PspC domain
MTMFDGDSRSGGTAMTQFEVRARLKVRDGKLDGFKRQAAELMQRAREKDTGTVAYDWFLSKDGTEPVAAGSSAWRRVNHVTFTPTLCGGPAEYFTIDPTLIRVLFVVFALLGGPGLVVYLVLWIVVPERPPGAA